MTKKIFDKTVSRRDFLKFFSFLAAFVSFGGIATLFARQPEQPAKARGGYGSTGYGV